MIAFPNPLRRLLRESDAPEDREKVDRLLDEVSRNMLTGGTSLLTILRIGPALEGQAEALAERANVRLAEIAAPFSTGDFRLPAVEAMAEAARDYAAIPLQIMDLIEEERFSRPDEKMRTPEKA